MTQPKVVGRRIGFWQGTNSLMIAIIFGVCPLCVIFAVRAGGAFALAGLGVAALGVWLYRNERRAYVIISACPVCGVEAQRDFRDATNKKVWPVPCGRCLAYLRLQPKKLEVREEAFTASNAALTPYQLRSEQYEAVVPRRDDEDRQFEFAMPAMCAVCCASDAPFTREIGYAGNVDAGGGLTGTVLYRSTNNPVGRPPDRDDSFERALKHVQTPACAQHSKPGSGNAMEYDGGTLRFASYRFYKAFCELNHITADSRPS